MDKNTDIICKKCGKKVPILDAVCDENISLCKKCYAEDFRRCGCCGDIIPKADLIIKHDFPYCNRCNAFLIDPDNCDVNGYEVIQPVVESENEDTEKKVMYNIGYKNPKYDCLDKAYSNFVYRGDDEGFDMKIDIIAEFLGCGIDEIYQLSTIGDVPDNADIDEFIERFLTDSERISDNMIYGFWGFYINRFGEKFVIYNTCGAISYLFDEKFLMRHLYSKAIDTSEENVKKYTTLAEVKASEITPEFKSFLVKKFEGIIAEYNMKDINDYFNIVFLAESAVDYVKHKYLEFSEVLEFDGVKWLHTVWVLSDGCSEDIYIPYTEHNAEVIESRCST